MDKIEEKVIAIVKRVIDYEGKIITSDSLEIDLGMDSLDKIILVMNIEKEFNILFGEDSAENLERVKDIVDYVKSETMV